MGRREEINYLIIGDSHIPDRAESIPIEIEEYLNTFIFNKGKFHQVFFTGDLVRSIEFEQYLSSLSIPNNIMIVSGNMDMFNNIERDSEIVYTDPSFPELKIGVIHGHQIHPRGHDGELSKYAKKLGVNILINGHTHKDQIKLYEDLLLINPGSCVGTWSTIASGIPSFIIMRINHNNDNIVQINLKTIRIEKHLVEKSMDIYFKSKFFYA